MTGRCDDPTESLSVSLPSDGSITLTQTGGCLLLEGPASVTVYRSVLETARYASLAEEPDPSSREVVFAVFDGLFYSSDNITLQITTVDDNPTVVRV